MNDFDTFVFDEDEQLFVLSTGGPRQNQLIGDHNFLNLSTTFGGVFTYEMLGEMYTASRASMIDWDRRLGNGGQKSFWHLLVFKQAQWRDKLKVVKDGQDQALHLHYCCRGGPRCAKEEHDGAMMLDERGQPIVWKDYVLDLTQPKKPRVREIHDFRVVGSSQTLPVRHKDYKNLEKALKGMLLVQVLDPSFIVGDFTDPDPANHIRPSLPNPTSQELIILEELAQMVLRGDASLEDQIRIERRHLLDRHRPEFMNRNRTIWGRTPDEACERKLRNLRRLQQRYPDAWVPDPYGRLVPDVVVTRHPTNDSLVRIGDLEEFGLWTLALKLAAKPYYNRRYALEEEMRMRIQCVQHYQAQENRQPTIKELDDWLEEHSWGWNETVCQDYMRTTWQHLRLETDENGAMRPLPTDLKALLNELVQQDPEVADRLIALVNRFRVIISPPTLRADGTIDWSTARIYYLTVEEIRDLVRDNGSFRMQRSSRSQRQGWFYSEETIARARGDEAGGRQGRLSKCIYDIKFRWMKRYHLSLPENMRNPITVALLGDIIHMRDIDEWPSDQSIYLLMAQRMHDVDRGLTELRGAYAVTNAGVGYELEDVLKTIPKLRGYSRKPAGDPLNWVSTSLLMAVMEPAWFRDPDMIRNWGGFFPTTVAYSLDNRISNLLGRGPDGRVVTEENFVNQQHLLLELWENQKIHRLKMHMLETFQYHARWRKTIHIRPEIMKLLDGIPSEIIEARRPGHRLHNEQYAEFWRFIQRLNYLSDRRALLYCTLSSHGSARGVRGLSSGTAAGFVREGYGTDNGLSLKEQTQMIERLEYMAWLNGQYDKAVFLLRGIIYNFRFNHEPLERQKLVVQAFSSGLNPTIGRKVLKLASGFLPLEVLIPTDEPKEVTELEDTFEAEENKRLTKQNVRIIETETYAEEMKRFETMAWSAANDDTADWQAAAA